MFIGNIKGKDFEELYLKYEKEGRQSRTVEARQLWYAIIESQVGFYFLFIMK